METLAEIVRGLNAVRTVDQARLAVGESLTAIHGAYGLPNLSSSSAHSLDLARKPLESFYARLGKLPGAGAVPEWPANRNLVQRAYVDIAGAGGQSEARGTVSLVSELQRSTKDVAAGIGTGLHEVASVVGDTAGSVLGGLLSGLGPVIILMLALVGFFYLKRKGIL